MVRSLTTGTRCDSGAETHLCAAYTHPLSQKQGPGGSPRCCQRVLGDCRGEFSRKRVSRGPYSGGDDLHTDFVVALSKASAAHQREVMRVPHHD
jgi:hypothetical protein